jgi:hypothetical protein
VSSNLTGSTMSLSSNAQDSVVLKCESRLDSGWALLQPVVMLDITMLS